MESTRDLVRHGNLYPAVFSLLAELPAGTLPHAQQHLRAPGGIYNLSIQRVFAAFRNDLDALEDVHRNLGGPPPIEDSAIRLIAAHIELLESMAAHIDDAYQILRACHPPQPDVTESFADRWLEKAGVRGAAQFKRAIAPYRETLLRVVNKIKHEHGQLRLMAFSNTVAHSAGYYLESIDSTGVATQDPELHPNHTAFSFNRDLRFHFVNLYDVGNALKMVLSPALRQLGIRITGRRTESPSTELLAIAKRIEALGTIVFPDEVRISTPHVRVQEHDGNVTLSVRLPSLAVFRPPEHGMVATVLVKGDGFTTQYQVPYFSRDLGVWTPQETNRRLPAECVRSPRATPR